MPPRSHLRTRRVAHDRSFESPRIGSHPLHIMTHVNRHPGRYQWAAALLLFLALAILLFGTGLAGHLTTAYIGRDEDPPIYMWFLRWWRYALDHRINPFF